MKENMENIDLLVSEDEFILNSHKKYWHKSLSVTKILVSF